MSDSPTWNDCLDTTRLIYGQTVMEQWNLARSFMEALMESLRDEERRRDPYERLTDWMKTLPDWRDSTCRCYECY